MDIRPALRIDPQTERQLAQYMRVNAEETEYYRRMVKENPEHAVKTIMARKMVQEDERRTVANRLRPVIKYWVDQHPGLHGQIMERIRNAQPVNEGVAYLDEALRAKTTPVSPTAGKVASGLSP